MDSVEIEKAAVAVKENITLLDKQAQEIDTLVVKTQEQVVSANDVKVNLKRIRKAIEEKMDEYIKPSKTIITNAKDIISKIEREFAPALNKVVMLEKAVGDKILYFLQEERKQKEAQERKNREEMAKHQEKIDAGKNPNKIKQPEVKYVAPVTKLAETHTRKRWTYEMINEDEVERFLCTPDSVKINTAIKVGLRTAKGLRIYEKETLI